MKDNTKTILKKIKPSRFEERNINSKVSKFLKKLNKSLEGISSKGESAKAIVGGSIAKGTWLKGDHDIDIFVLFDKDNYISDVLEGCLTKTFKIVERIKGSRDYFQVLEYGFNFEIVPILRIKKAKEAKVITDASPLHVKWVRSYITKKTADEVRLLKAFCIAQGVYGAESYIKGFSGYVLEILIAYYGSLKNLVKHAINWKPYKMIDINKHYEGINKDKISPLIVIDPTEAKRNAAAALSLEKFKKFIAACKGYWRTKSLDFFEKKRITLSDLTDKSIVCRVKGLEGRKDIVGSKLLKALEYIEKKLKEESYIVKEADWYWNTEGNREALFWFKVKSEELPKFKKHYGPPLTRRENLIEFKTKWRGYRLYTEDNRVFINLPRRFVRLNDFLKDLIKKDEEILKRVKWIRVV